MDQQTITQQMVSFQQAVVDTMMTSMDVIWDQSSRAFGTLLDQAPWVPEHGRKAYREWVDGNRERMETLKQAIDNTYERLGNCLAVCELGQRQEQQSTQQGQQHEQSQPPQQYQEPQVPAAADDFVH